MPTKFLKAVLAFFAFLLYLKPVLGSLIPTLLVLTLFLAWGFVLVFVTSSMSMASRSQI